MPATVEPFNLADTYVRLRPDVSVEPLPVDNHFWQRVMSGQLGSFHHEYLMCHFNFEHDWDSWEMHPGGDEIVLMLNGEVDFVLERAGEHQTIKLDKSGAYVIVPKGTWHTAKVKRAAQMLFITAGEGTQLRPVTA